MPQHDRATDPDEQQCREAVNRLTNRYRWELLPGAEWAARAYACLTQGVMPDPDTAAFYAYAEVMYLACSGRHGEERQRQGYTELHRYLYAFVSAQDPDNEDIVQLALLKVFRLFDHCASPGGFLMFARFKLRDAKKELARYRAKYERRIAIGIAGEDSASLVDAVPDEQYVDALERVIAYEDRVLLERYRTEFLRKHRRAVRSLDAVWLKYIAGLDDHQIAERLGVSVTGVYTLRCRGKQLLKADPTWRALAAEFGILLDEAKEEIPPR